MCAAVVCLPPPHTHMNLHPGDRWSADHYLTSWPRQLFPPHFSDVLHPFFASLLHMDPDTRLAATAGQFKQLTDALQGQAAAAAAGKGRGSSSGTGGPAQQAAVRVRVSEGTEPSVACFSASTGSPGPAGQLLHQCVAVCMAVCMQGTPRPGSQSVSHHLALLVFAAC